MRNKTLKEEFKLKWNKDVRCVCQISDEISDWWLSKIEEVINDIPGVIFDSQGGAETTELKQQLRSKYLGK